MKQATTTSTSTTVNTSTMNPNQDDDLKKNPEDVQEDGMVQAPLKAAEVLVSTMADPEALSSSGSTSSLSSDLDDPTCTPSDTDDSESMVHNIAYLNEKQGLLQRFSAELLQDDLYIASTAQQDIAIHKQEEEEQESLSASSFSLSEEEDDDDDFCSNATGTSIWIRAKKVLRRLSRHRGVLYHPASNSGVAVAASKRNSKKRAASGTVLRDRQQNKKQRRVRFGPDIIDSGKGNRDIDNDESSDASSVSEDDLERAARCARRIIDGSNTAVRRISAKDFAKQTDASSSEIFAPDIYSSTRRTPDRIDAYVLSLNSIMADPKPIPFPPTSIPFHTAG